MSTFIVTVICISLSNCPLSNGYRDTYEAASKKQCEQVARSVITRFGYAVKEFYIECRAK